MKIRIVIALLCLLATTVSGRATTYYVSLSGNDGNPGTTEQPFRTVNKAVGVLRAGDTLYIRGGTYIDRFVDTDFTAGGTVTARILVSGYPGEKVVIKNGGTDGITGFMMAGREYIEIQDMTLDGSTFNVGAVVNLFNNNVTLRRVEITGGWGNGILGGGSGHRFIDLKVHGNGRQPSADYSPGHNGLYMASSNTLVQGGEFSDNQCYGIRFVDSDPSHRASSNTVVGVRSYSNGYGKGLNGTSKCGSGGGGIVIGDTNNVVRDSLVHDNLHGIEITGLSGKVVEGAQVRNSVICRNVGQGVGFGLWAGATGTQILDNLVCQNSEAIVNRNTANTPNTTITGNTTVFDGDFIALYNARTPPPPPPPVPPPPPPLPPAPDPSTLPLLQSWQLQYRGGFRPPGAMNGVSFDYGGQPIAFNPENNSLFVGAIMSDGYSGLVAEISIPPAVNSVDPKAMSQATYVQPTFVDPTEGRLREVSGATVNLYGLLVYGNRLHGAASIYYDASNSQRVSHFARSLNLTTPSFSGWSQVWQADRQGFVSGMMTLVPAEWQAKLGGPAIVGQCCIPIIERTSYGPSAFAFDPALIGQATVPAQPLLYYDSNHRTLGDWEQQNPNFGMTTRIGGVAIIAGTRTALFVGSNGLGITCYGIGTADKALADASLTDNICYDPTDPHQGNHAYPYRYQVWAYDLNDFAAVKAGAKQPWEIVPYGVWPLEFPTPALHLQIGGVTYDAQRQILYVSQRDGNRGDYSTSPVIHAFQMNIGAPGPPPPPPPPPPPVDLCVTAPLRFTVSKWPASLVGSRSITYNSDRAVRLELNLLAPRWTATATDVRGCVVTVTRHSSR